MASNMSNEDEWPLGWSMAAVRHFSPNPNRRYIAPAAFRELQVNRRLVTFNQSNDAGVRAVYAHAMMDVPLIRIYWIQFFYIKFIDFVVTTKGREAHPLCVKDRPAMSIHAGPSGDYKWPCPIKNKPLTTAEVVDDEYPLRVFLLLRGGCCRCRLRRRCCWSVRARTKREKAYTRH